MVHAIIATKAGGPEVFSWQEVSLTPPGPGEVQIKQTAIGLNYIDTYHRTGQYPVPEGFPAILGMEAAGEVTALGEGIQSLKIGDRVAYGVGPLGAYTQARNIPEQRLIPLPDTISDERAAAMMLKGLTAHYLLRRTFVVNKDHTLLIHAAAGGVGLLLTQWAKALGATVIGTVGSDEKAELAKQNGCDHTILYKDQKVPEAVMEITQGRGVNVVYDAVGKDTILDSIACLCPLGMLVSYGQASGPIPPLDLALIAEKSLFLTRPSLMHYKANPKELIQGAAELFELFKQNKLKIHIGQSYFLKDAAEAHRDLEARNTYGSTILFAG